MSDELSRMARSIQKRIDEAIIGNSCFSTSGLAPKELTEEILIAAYDIIKAEATKPRLAEIVITHEVEEGIWTLTIGLEIYILINPKTWSETKDDIQANLGEGPYYPAAIIPVVETTASFNADRYARYLRVKQINFINSQKSEELTDVETTK